MDITNAAIAVSQPNYFIHQVDSSEESQSYRHNLAKAFEQTLMDNDSARQSSLDVDDTIQESLTKPGDSEFIATYLRIRPLLEDEKKEQSSHEYFTVEDDKFVVTHPVPPAPPNRMYTNAQRELFEPQKFEFKRVFKPDSTQHTVYENCVAPLVNNVLAEGVTMNPLFLTYGETSSGKSYTVFGSSTQPGVVPRAMCHLFERIGNRIWLSSLFRPSFGADVVELSRTEMEAELSSRTELLKSAALIDSNKAAEQKRSEAASVSSSQSLGGSEQAITMYYQIWMSCLEIYNETIYDLLDSQVRPIRHAVRHGQRGNSDSGTTTATGESIKRTTVELRTDKRGLVFPRNVRYALITSLSDAERYVELARANLQISKTALNSASSRSHAVFTLKVVKVPVYPQQPSTSESKTDPPVRRCGPPRLASIAFCDLAGSERASKAHSVASRDAMPTRLLETGNINTSLLTLKICIDALRSNQRAANSGGNEPQKVIPYRASKLTRLFSNYFSFDRAFDKDKPSQKCNGFNSQMVVLTTIAPSAKLFNESVQILEFATIAKEVITSTVKADEPIPILEEPTPSEVDLRKVKAIAIVPSAPSRESIAFETECATKKHSNVHDPNLKRLERVDEDEDEDEGEGEQDLDEAIVSDNEPAEPPPDAVANNKPVVKQQAAASKQPARTTAPFQPVQINAFSFRPPQPVGAAKKNRGVLTKIPGALPAATARSNATENSSAVNAQLAAQSSEISQLTEEIARLKAELSRARTHLASRDREISRLRAEAERQESRLRQELFVHYDKIIMDQRARYERRIELLCDRLEEHNEQRIESLQQAFRRREQQEGCRAAKRRRTSLESDAD